MSGEKTPDGGKNSFGKLYSPSSKRSLNFNLWDVGSYFGNESESTVAPTQSPKRQPKTGTLQKISDLKPMYVRDEIHFRVAKMNIFEKDGNKTMRIYGVDESGEIAIFFFPAEFSLADNLIQFDKCYSLRNFTVAIENPDYPSYSGHACKVNAGGNSYLETCTLELPPIPFTLASISEALLSEPKALVDMVAIVGLNWGCKSYRRQLTLTQKETGDCIALNLYGEAAEEFGDDDLIIIALRRAVVVNRGGTTLLEARPYTLVWKNPPLPEAENLNPAKQKLAELRQVVAEASAATRDAENCEDQ